MRSERFLTCVRLATLAATVSSLAVLANGCTQAATPPPAFDDDTGEAANPTPAAYPAGPYGIGVGSVIPNFEFIGYQDAMKTTKTMQAIALADFWNPHARDTTYKPTDPTQDDRLFPASSGYENAGKPKPTVLLIDIASVWCNPCNYEAQYVLPGQHAKYAPCGGEFLLDLHDSQTVGSPATPTNLKNWTASYKVNFPSVIDPSYKLDQVFSADAFPNNGIVDTTTMKIVRVLAGAAITLTCNDVSECTTDADCNTCAGQCSDGSGTACTVATDCESGVTCSFFCGDGTSCSTSADCAGKTCTEFSFWTDYEKLLDTTRTGCTVK
jgi:hypothetical protein